MSVDRSIWKKVLHYLKLKITEPQTIQRLSSDFDTFQKTNEQEVLQLIRNQTLILNEIHSLREDMHTEIRLLEARMKERSVRQEQNSQSAAPSSGERKSS